MRAAPSRYYTLYYTPYSLQVLRACHSTKV
jgi:hypothetical protein